MTDLELLEAAARAAGLTLQWTGSELTVSYTPEESKARGGVDGYFWNPLRDDGDALRLAVKLGIDVYHYSAFDGCYEAFSRAAWHFDDEGYGECDEKHGDDTYAATRRAIVRAAAQLGAHKEGA